MPGKLITEREAAAKLSLHVQTLRNWRHLGREIPYVKLGSAIRYDDEVIDKEIEARTVHPRQ